jgi:hypothetical protein
MSEALFAASSAATDTLASKNATPAHTERDSPDRLMASSWERVAIILQRLTAGASAFF